MKNIFLLGAAALTLAACSGGSVAVYGPDGDVVGDDGGEEGVFGENSCQNSTFDCGGEVVAISYDADSDTLTIQGTPFDETPLGGTYIRANLIDNTRIAGYDFDFAGDNVNTFLAYENDDEFAINPYFALNRDSDDGSITVGQAAVADGYRDGGYGGFWIRVNEAGSIPVEELALYDGIYAGIVTQSGDSLEAGSILLSEGDVFFEVDFTDGFIKGQTFNRTIDGVEVRDVVFDDVTFNSASTFSGNATSVGLGDNNWTGTYQGVFAGDQANTVGGVFVVTQGEFFTDGEGNEVSATETGTFLAEKTSPPSE